MRDYLIGAAIGAPLGIAIGNYFAWVIQCWPKEEPFNWRVFVGYVTYHKWLKRMELD